MWSLDKLKQYIADGIEENIHLDYKAAGSIDNKDEKKKEISKDISAFANSDGGTIIYGVREFSDKNKKHLPEKIEPIDRLEYSKEWLEQIINSTISPRVPGIIITPIQIGNIDENKVVYIVDIPKSTTAHQAKDKRYYRRYNFESIMMEDWEIKDIINRQTRTQVDIKFYPHFNKNQYSYLIRSRTAKLKFNIVAINAGNKVVEYVDFMIAGKPQTADTITTRPNIFNTGYFELYFKNEIVHKAKIADEEFTFNIQRLAILPSTIRKIGEIEFYSSFFIDKHKMLLTVSTNDNIKRYHVEGEELIEWNEENQ